MSEELSLGIHGVVRLLGVPQMIKNLRGFQNNFVNTKVASALKIEMEIEATECKKRCPVYVGPPGPNKPIPGLLRNSIKVVGPDRVGHKLTAKITAGGAAGAYAIPQHERLDYFHVVGQAKYIESVLMESRPYLLARVAARARIGQEDLK